MTPGNYGETHISINHGGDISSTSADAVVVAVNSNRQWFDGTINAIRRTGGQSFFNQLAKEDLYDGKVVLAQGPAFRDIIFVIDDLKMSLGEVVKKGLAAADTRGFHSVSLPDMRITTRNVVGKSIEELHEEIFEAARGYVAEHPQTGLRYINLVFRD